jgi:hydrogenase-4 component B
VTLFVLALVAFAAGAAASLLLARRPGAALRVGPASTVLGSALGLAAAARALAGGGGGEAFALPWGAPLAAFVIALDPLSAFFEVALFALAIPAALYGATYMRPHLGRRGLPAFLAFQNLLVASIALVFAARQAVLFLVAWEVMAVASFLLVTFEHQDAEVRRAGLVFLVASHLGTAFLFAFFVVAGREAGSLDFAAFDALRTSRTVPAAALAGLALVGFGAKAGLVPFHVWLPEAHPAAPSHISALLSGVMIKTGVYGLVRVVLWLPPAPATWGLVLSAIGLGGALVAITLALGQRDLKRALAYSSVENIGIICLAIGLAVACAASGERALAAVAWAGALLHVWNHAAMKGLAFMGAGAVAHAVHGRNLERMGGLLARLPRTGAALLVGLAALAALPPLNGFASEWLVYVGLLRSAVSSPGGASILAGLAIATLAMVGGIAAAVFARAGGVALLGAPRSPEAEAAHEPGPGLWAPLAALAVACALLGLFPASALRLAAPAIAQAATLSSGALAAALAPAVDALEGPLRAAGVALVAAAVALWFAARRARAGRAVTESETWSCGYARPTAHMQYTASSFGEAFLSWLAPRALQPRGRVTPPSGVLPARADARFEIEDPARVRLFDPLFRLAADRASRLRRYQSSRLNLQLVYTVATLLALAALLVLRA